MGAAAGMIKNAALPPQNLEVATATPPPEQNISQHQ
jgi:hypothetical protein